MDVHTPAGSRLQLGLNGSHDGSRRRFGKHHERFEDESWQFLSHEERECILFLEETIDALDHDLEDSDHSSGSSTPVEGQCVTPSLASIPEVPSSLKEQDIIDLVQSQPEPPVPRQETLTSVIPDFQSLAVNPETHFEFKSRQDRADGFPSSYNFPLPLLPPVPAEESHSLYHPAGSIPTPVLIAQKIAEHQGGASPVTQSALKVGCRKSLEVIGSSAPSLLADHSVKQGPRTTAKPIRYPDNIHVWLSSRDYGQTISKANVSVQQRQAQVLANLTGTSPTHEVAEGNRMQKFLNRSISFRDPAPDKSRMEALTKLGLVRDRAMSNPVHRMSMISTRPPQFVAMESCSNSVEHESKPEAASTYSPSSGKPQTSLNDFNIYGEKTKVITPSAVSDGKTNAKSQCMETCSKDKTLSCQPAAEISPHGSGSYGGKTKVTSAVPPTSSQMTFDVTPHHTSKPEGRYIMGSTALTITETKNDALSEFANLGVKTVTTSASTSVKNAVSLATVTAVDTKPGETTPSLAPTRTRDVSHDFSNLRSRAWIEVLPQMHNVKPDASPAKSDTMATTPRVTPPAPSMAARSMSFRIDSRVPEGAKLGRQGRTASFHGGQLGPMPPEPRRRSFSKSPFWPQGITVQFSGRGPTDESRREALRKLGLLRDTS